eukprot:gb/GFBE01012389.1/.p1 GENE.gb/GFBE01012389.1/~~gb/GFBE01012389.1/.p1  ORF type:complete len:305 (+),score=51.00 gb/GFBE01012389.1/:1-915(+)
MEERKRWLLEQPVPVLVAHAQECGVDVTNCTEKSDLVEQILQGEPSEFGGWRDDDDVPNEGTPQASSPSRAHGRMQPTHVDTSSDADLAQRLQHEEDHRTFFTSRPTAPSSGGGLELLGRLSQAGAASSPNGGDRSDVAMQELMRLLLAGSAAASPARSSPAPAVAGGDSGRQGEDADSSQAQVQALTRSLVQVLSDRENAQRNLAGMQALAELLTTLLPNAGVEQEVVESRTGTMTFNEANMPRSDTGPQDDSERQCMVCLERFQDGENLRILPCLHRYHLGCVDRWLKENRHCPVCKHDITS